MEMHMYDALGYIDRGLGFENKQLLNHYPNILRSNDLLNFNDWLTIEYMKEKNIKVLLSFKITANNPNPLFL